MAIPNPQPGHAALITGASSGIGAELARQLCARGHDAILVARRVDRLEALAADLRSTYGRRVEVAPCDLANERARGDLVEVLQKLDLNLDVLVLCAGFGLGGPFITEDPERITAMVRTNVEATMALSRALIPPMAKRGRGAVLFVSSMAGNQPMPNFGAYAATKAAVTSFAESLHCELKANQITVTALCPGGVTTEFSTVGGLEHIEKRTPSAIMISPKECASAGLKALDRGKRVAIPGPGVRAMAWFGAHAPRAIWLPLCKKMFS
jgi:short-subunit dehydrogenase